MASGPEMLMNSLLKAMGFDPRDFIQKVDAFFNWTHAQITATAATAQSIDQRVARIETDIAEIKAALRSLLHHRTIDHEHYNGTRTGIAIEYSDAPAERSGADLAGGGNGNRRIGDPDQGGE